MICVDASVAVKWVIDEADSPAAIRLVALARQREHYLIAPYLLPFEVSNVLRQQCIRLAMTTEEARRRFSMFLSFDVQLVYDVDLHDQAIEIAGAFNLPATYDAHYLALCDREGCDFWTADKRLLNALRGRLPFVRDLAALTDDAIQPAG